MSNENAWFDTGFEGMKAEQQRLDDQQGPQRFWIRGGESKDVVMVDDTLICLHEHNPKIGGSYRNWLTCIARPYPNDAACCYVLGPKSKYYCGFITAVDCSAWVDDRGNKHQYELRLMPFKFRSLNKYKRLKAQRTGRGEPMAMTMWTFTREDNNAPQVGDDWQFKRIVQSSQMFPFVCYRGKKVSELWAEAEQNAEALERVKRVFQVDVDEEHKLPRVVPAFNYFELLKPKTPDEVRMILGNVEFEDRRSGGGAATSGPADEDAVPF